jgi:hypothetical protein
MARINSEKQAEVRVRSDDHSFSIHQASLIDHDTTPWFQKRVQPIKAPKTTEFARLHCPFKSTSEGICPKKSQKPLPDSA